MTYSVGGTIIINTSGQIDWSRIKNKPSYIDSVGGRVSNTGTGTFVVSSTVSLEIIGTKLRSVKTNTLGDCNCNCVCNCGEGGSGGGEGAG